MVPRAKTALPDNAGFSRQCRHFPTFERRHQGTGLTSTDNYRHGKGREVKGTYKQPLKNIVGRQKLKHFL